MDDVLLLLHELLGLLLGSVVTRHHNILDRCGLRLLALVIALSKLVGNKRLMVLY